jgi:hypothetical protein
LQFRTSTDKVSLTSSVKNKLKIKRIGTMALVIELLPNKHEALSSVSSNTKKKSIFLTHIDRLSQEQSWRHW